MSEVIDKELLNQRFRERLQYVIDKSGRNMVQIADDLHMHKSNFTKYLSGSYMPRKGTLQMIADYFHVDALWLYGLSEDNTLPEVSITKCVEAYLIADELVSRNHLIATTNPHVSFAVFAKDDSLSGARIFENDIVLIVENANTSNGDICLIKSSHGILLRRVYIDGSRIELRSENPKFSTIVLKHSRSEYSILGKAVAVMFEV